MSPELADVESEPPHRRRFRFSLKTALVLVTIACIALGCFIAGYRRAAEIRARDIAVQNTILGNLSKAPPLLATRQTPPPERILRMSDFGDVVPTKGIIREGTNGGTIYVETLNISKASTADTPVNVAKYLLAHFESGLASTGLRRTSIVSSPHELGRNVSASSIWQSPKYGQTVVIDVAIDITPAPTEAKVRILYIHHKGLTIL